MKKKRMWQRGVSLLLALLLVLGNGPAYAFAQEETEPLTAQEETAVPEETETLEETVAPEETAAPEEPSAPEETAASEETEATRPVPRTTVNAVDSGSCGENLTWTLSEDGLLTISGSGAMRDYFYDTTPWNDCDINITSVVIESGVTDIGNYAFYSCSDLSTVDIPDSVASIGEFAFGHCINLTDIAIPDSVTVIGNDAFFCCNSFTSISIPDSVTTIGSAAFCGCESLTSIIIGSGVSAIGEYAFSGCRSLNGILIAEDNSFFSCDEFGILFNKTKTKLIQAMCTVSGSYSIPEGVAAIGVNAFSECFGLTSITIPDSVETIGDYAFSFCESLTDITIPDGVTTIGEDAFSNCISLNGITIPDSVTSIGRGAFRDCSALEDVIISNNITCIDESTFYGCSSLVSMNIPDSITTIGGYAFSECSGLKNLTIPDSVTTIGLGAFAHCSGLTSVIIPDGVTALNETFLSCTGLTRVVIPDSVTSIGYHTFEGCESLTDVIFGKSITTIGNYAFSRCGGLTGITIPDSVTSIGQGVFYGCYSLSGVTFGKGVTSVGNCVFGDCYNLTEITFYGNAPVIASDAFEEVNAIAYYPVNNETWTSDVMKNYGGTIIWMLSGDATDTLRGSCGKNLNWHLTADGILTISGTGTMADYSDERAPWYEYRERIVGLVVENGPISIGNFAFEDCRNLTSVTISDSITSIGVGAFYNCSGLNCVTIPDSVMSIGGVAFSGCNSLTDIVIPDGITCIDEVFTNCGSLTHVTIPDSVDSMDHAFSGCTSLTHATIPEGVTGINGTFTGCSSLTSITIPDSVTTIGDKAFYGCVSLTGLIIPDNVTSIGYGAFYDCSSLTDMIIPYGVTNLEATFSGCTNLTNVVIADSVSTIGGNTFSGCTKLTGIKLPEGVIEIGYNAFSDCTSLTSINIPDGVGSIGREAFSGCTGLTSLTIPGSCTNIHEYAFQLCSSLTSVTLLDGIASIGNLAFFGCSSLVSMIIPDSVVSIGVGAFRECSALESVILSKNITCIEDALFYDCSCLTDMNIPDGVTIINPNAFNGCSSLVSVNIPDSVSSIGSGAFWNCTNLLSIVIPDGVTSIENFTFDECSSLKSITIPDSVTSFGHMAFNHCSSLTDVRIPDGTTAIREKAFFGCSSLSHLTIPDSVYIIDTNAFSCCTSLISVTIGGGVQTMGIGAFGSCTNLTDVTIREGTTCIGAHAFGGCGKLSKVSIPNSITTIGDFAFFDCESLDNVMIPDGVPIINMGVFSECTSLTGIIIPENVAIIDMNAFYNCTSLKTIIFRGDAPAFYGVNIFFGVDATAYYPAGNETWTSRVMQNYEGTITWLPYCIGEHSMVTDPALPPTCTENGMTEGVHCSDCNEVLVKQEMIPATGHSYGDWQVHSEPTAADYGENRRYCVSCEAYESRQTLPLGHVSATADTLAAGETLTLMENNIVMINKDMYFRCELDSLAGGTIRMGHGKTAYTSQYIEITETHLNVWYYYTADSNHCYSYAHGLEITDWLEVTIHKEKGNATITIATEGGSLSGKYDWRAGANGPIFCEVEGVDLRNVDCRWWCQDFDADYWFFGDSWFSSSSSARWTSYMLGDGHTDVLLAAYGGMGAPVGAAQFEEFLKYDTPKYAIWCLGMNNGDYNGKLSTSWLPNTEKFLTLCEEHGVIPILATIPTTPKVNNRLKNAWVEASGYRYIDFDLALVQNHVTGEWYEGTAASDLNHPTTAGAQLLYPQLHADFPELAEGNREGCTHKLAYLQAKQPECVDGGRNAYYVCTLCAAAFLDEGATQTTTTARMLLPPAGHSYDEGTVTKEATEETEGEKLYTCTVCAAKKTEVLPKLPHVHKWLDSNATIKECTSCGHVEGGYRIEAPAQEVWIDGVKQKVYSNTTGTFVQLENTDAKTMTVYTYNDAAASDPHTQYPTGMQVWLLNADNGTYTAERISQFDDLLGYAGTSIRVKGIKGIRILTTLDKALRSRLMDGSLGYTLLEYGTCVAWASDLGGSAPVLGDGRTVSNFAYKQNVADPIFADTGSRIQYTNVLVGFTDDQLAKDLVMRPYIILEDSQGQQITLYGGCITRSIAYVAKQNQNTFPEGSKADAYIEDMISKVYG